VVLGRAGDDTVETADRLYEELTETGVEVVYDDREVGPGEKFNDAELLGCPLRIVVGRKALAEGEVEAQERRSGSERRLAVGDAARQAAEIVAEFG
jgi:prolyl-tRNA synthetase